MRRKRGEKREETRGKRQEGRDKREETRGKRQEGRDKREETRGKAKRLGRVFKLWTRVLKP
jgi:hypothetical protein